MHDMRGLSALAGMTPVDPDQPGQGLLLELPVLAEQLAMLLSAGFSLASITAWLNAR